MTRPPCLSLYTCAPFPWAEAPPPCCPFHPISLVLAQRNGVEPPKKSAFLPRWLHHPRERYCFVDCTFLARLGEGLGGLTGRSSQLDAVGCDVGASSSWERRAGPNSSRGGTHKRVSLGLHPVSLRKSKEMGWNGQGRRGLLPNKTAHTCPAPRRSIFSHHPSTQRCSPSPVTALVRLRPSGVNSLLTVCRLKCIIILMICVLEGAFE